MTCKYVETTNQGRPDSGPDTPSLMELVWAGPLTGSVMENRIPYQYKLREDQDCFAIINFR